MGKQYPNFGSEAEMWSALEIPKHVWIELYADLYRQTHGETETDTMILGDAINRADLVGRTTQGKRATAMFAKLTARD